jgi:ferredoxin-NADP reductase
VYRMIIHDRRDEADGVISLSLGHADGGELPRWAPGAHIDVALGNGLTRQYSLCSDPADNRRWRIGVLREPDSRGGSKYVFDKLHSGDIVEVGEPRNHFELATAPCYLFVAGGVGITPILPMVARAEASGAEWTLLYGGRTRTSMAFVDELARHGDRVMIAPQDEVGLLNLAALLGRPRPDTLVYACGPEALLDAVETHMGSWPAGSLRMERFTPTTIAPSGPDETFDVEFRASGVTATVAPGRSILTVAEESGIVADWSCREGTCGSCETPLVTGRADHRDSLLTDEEKEEQNTMMICVSRAERGCPRLVLDL